MLHGTGEAQMAGGTQSPPSNVVDISKSFVFLKAWNDLLSRFQARIRSGVGKYPGQTTQSLPGALQGLVRATLDLEAQQQGIQPVDRGLYLPLANWHEGELKYRLAADEQKVWADMKRGLMKGMSPAEMNQRLQTLKGLDVRSARQVERYRQELEEQGKRGTVLDQSVNRFAAQLRTRRANLIANHEAAQLMNKTRRAMWEQEFPHRRMTWVKQKNGACALCSALAKQGPKGMEEAWVVPMNTQHNGKIVSFSGTLGGKSFLFPPVHPHCRCTVRLLP